MHVIQHGRFLAVLQLGRQVRMKGADLGAGQPIDVPLKLEQSLSSVESIGQLLRRLR
jgi:hypothetical protein